MKTRQRHVVWTVSMIICNKNSLLPYWIFWFFFNNSLKCLVFVFKQLKDGGSYSLLQEWFSWKFLWVRVTKKNLKSIKKITVINIESDLLVGSILKNMFLVFLFFNWTYLEERSCERNFFLKVLQYIFLSKVKYALIWWLWTNIM